MTTPKHEALAERVAVDAVALLCVVRDYNRNTPQSTAARLTLAARHNIDVRRGAGIEKAWIGFGDGFVVKVGKGGAVDREASLSLEHARRHVLALTTPLTQGVAVQERAVDTLANLYTGGAFRIVDVMGCLPRDIQRQARRLLRVVRAIGIGDMHSANVGVMPNGRIKVIDFSL